MPLKQHKTAILIFANSSQEEVKLKPIANGEKLFDILTAKTLDTVSKSKLPYFHFTEQQQKGISFGERFTNAIVSILNMGFENVITIGNDSPQLTVRHIIEAERQLHQEKFVLGPSTDGGFYLMGISKSQFNASTFETLAWQSSILSKQLIDVVAKANITIVTLNTLFDIDSIQDIKSIIAYAHQLPKALLKEFLFVINSAKYISSESSLLYTNQYSRTFHNKGSPLTIQA